MLPTRPASLAMLTILPLPADTIGGRTPRVSRTAPIRLSDDAIPDFRRVFEKGLDLIPAGAVHQAVGALDPLMHGSDKIIDRWIIGEVERQVFDRQPFCDALSRGGPAAYLVDI